VSQIEVYISIEGNTQRIGTLFRQASRGRESVSFAYYEDWLNNPLRFSLEPGLKVGEGMFHPGADRSIFGSIGDSAPDTWGRRLMQRAERRQAATQARPPRTLQETDYLLGVTDLSRLGAMRFKSVDDTDFQSPIGQGVPGFIQLGRLLQSAERIERETETDEDLDLIFAPGTSLGGARPKASVVDGYGNLAIAKFPKDTDDYGIETWEHVALILAERAGITVAMHELRCVSEKPVLISWRFDRIEQHRIPFLSAMSLLQATEGDRASYPEIVDVLAEHGANTKEDSAELFRRMVFNILVSNVDDHLRNHGFLYSGTSGWVLSPAYDLNPTPTDLKQRILSTNISLDEGTCSIELALSQAELFGLKLSESREIVSQVGKAVKTWRNVATKVGVSKAEQDRMSSAFEHDDLIAAAGSSRPGAI